MAKDSKESSTKDAISTLQPEDRIKKLKQLEGEKKKEIAEMEKLIKESEKEITEQRKFVEKVPIPQVAQQDLLGLSEEAKQLLKTHRGVDSLKSDLLDSVVPVAGVSKRKSKEDEGAGNLEQTVAREPTRDLPHPAMSQYWIEAQRAPAVFDSAYVAHLKHTPAIDLYKEMSVIGELVSQKGYATADEMRRVEHIAGAMEEKIKDVQRGKYSSFTEDVAKAALVTQTLGSKIRDAYKATSSHVGHDYYKGN
ncbi:hypothetical protein HYV86_04230 [Candidatus Woesearchaeota archaeon]|nr:hypothetical protein [Candidatus Woesearchaeota archaeon]